MLQRRMKLVSKFIPWSSAPAAFRATALNHEIRNYAVKHQPVVKWTLLFLPRALVREFLPASGQADEICNRIRRFLLEQSHHDVALRCLENSVRSCGTCHEVSLVGQSIHRTRRATPAPVAAIPRPRLPS